MTIVTGHSRGSLIFAAFLLFVLVSPQVQANNDRFIKQAIEQAAANTPELQRTKARIAVEGRRVVLFGSVRLYLHKMLYELIAWKTVGVVEVDNEIHIVPQIPLSDTEIERKIWEIVKQHEQLHAAAFKVRIGSGTVFIDGTFSHPQDVIFFKKKVAAIEGVIAIDIDVAFRT